MPTVQALKIRVQRVIQINHKYLITCPGMSDGQMWGCLIAADTTCNASATAETVAAAHQSGVGKMLIGNNSQLAAIQSDRHMRGKPTGLTSPLPS